MPGGCSRSYSTFDIGLAMNAGETTSFSNNVNNWRTNNSHDVVGVVHKTILSEFNVNPNLSLTLEIAIHLWLGAKFSSHSQWVWFKKTISIFFHLEE